MLLFLIPFFNIVYYYVLAYKLAKTHNCDKMVCFLMGILPLVFLPVVAFAELKQKVNVYEEILKEYDKNYIKEFDKYAYIRR